MCNGDPEKRLDETTLVLGKTEWNASAAILIKAINAILKPRHG